MAAVSDLPVPPPIKPMLAKAVTSVPDQPGDGTAEWLYEPKWDGFRCIVFRNGGDVLLGSRNERPLTRYFPELVESVRAELPERCVIDGEIVVPMEQDGATRLSWEALSQRVHPAESRVRMLAERTPAHFVAFDVLALGEASLMGEPLSARRAALEEVFASGQRSAVHLTRVTAAAPRAREWFEAFEGAGLDGVVAKRLTSVYRPDQREMVKVKHHRTADCVVVGYRPHKSGSGIGSMLLGLYAGDELRMVGGASAFTAKRRVELLEELQPYRVGEGVVAAGEPNRWNARADNTFVPLRPELVIEVEYDQMEGHRFRHAARFLRWRPDKAPEQCTYDQLEVPVRYDLADVLAEPAQ